LPEGAVHSLVTDGRAGAVRLRDAVRREASILLQARRRHGWQHGAVAVLEGSIPEEHELEVEIVAVALVRVARGSVELLPLDDEGARVGLVGIDACGSLVE